MIRSAAGVVSFGVLAAQLMVFAIMAEGSQRPPATVSVVSEGNREELQGDVKTQAIGRVGALLNSCWYDSTTTKLYEFRDLVNVWSQVREGDRIVIDYQEPITAIGTGMPVPVSEIVLGLRELRLMTRHDETGCRTWPVRASTLR